MKTGIRSWLAALTLSAMLTSISPTHAETELSKAFGTCVEASGGVTSSMLECAATEYKLQDQRLNKAYRALSNGLDTKRRRELVEVQRLWIRFRDANCAFYADADSCTAATLAASSCTLQLTATRARELEDLK